MIISGLMLSCALFGISFRPIISSTQDTQHANPSNKTKNVLNVVARAMNLDLFKNPTYILFCLSNFLTCLGYYVPYTYIPHKATTLNISVENVSYLVSIIGIANTLGRVFFGYISDKPFINRLYVYSICLSICGIGKQKKYFQM